MMFGSPKAGYSARMCADCGHPDHEGVCLHCIAEYEHAARAQIAHQHVMPYVYATLAEYILLSAALLLYVRSHP